MRVRVHAQAELEEDLRHVCLDRRLGDEEPRGDRTIGESFGQKCEYFPLALGQLGERIRAALPSEQG